MIGEHELWRVWATVWATVGVEMEAKILPIRSDRSFDAETTRAMGLAFDIAKLALHDSPTLVHDVIARRIIELAATGVRDPDELAKRALHAVGVEK